MFDPKAIYTLNLRNLKTIFRVEIDLQGNDRKLGASFWFNQNEGMSKYTSKQTTKRQGTIEIL